MQLILLEDLTGSWSELDLLATEGLEDSSSAQEDNSSDRRERGSLKLQIPLDDDDDKEVCSSAPSSPKRLRKDTLELLQSPRLRSHSFDDLLSNVNNEDTFPSTVAGTASEGGAILLPLSPTRKTPLITFMDSSANSGSESDVETYGFSTATFVAVGARRQRKDLDSSTELSSDNPVSQGGAFTRFKGKFFQKVKFGASKPHSQPPHSTGAGSGITTSALSRQETEDPDVQTTRQKVMSVGQKFINSPSLLRKVGVNRSSRSPQSVPPASEDETYLQKLEARNKSQTKFVDI